MSSGLIPGKKDGFVIKAGWPEADLPDFKLTKANKYLQETIVFVRKDLQKKVSGSRKGNLNTSHNKSKPKVGRIFVNEKYDGWRKECLIILRNKFDSVTCNFSSDEDILLELQKSSIGQDGNLNRIQKLCMPFLRSKKHEVMAVGIQALDLEVPFDEIEVLQMNSDLIRRQVGLERLEILSTEDPDVFQGAGPHATRLRENPHSPGCPAVMFFNE